MTDIETIGACLAALYIRDAAMWLGRKLGEWHRERWINREMARRQRARGPAR